MTEGRRQLLAALQILSETEIALRCGVSQSAVSRWASGETIPSKRAQEMLREHVWTVVGPWETERRNPARRFL
jgi:transcriptional regulator with XRE-family HTH domain